MYAIAEIKGFDTKIKEGEKITVPKIDTKEGENIIFDKVKLLRKDDKLKIGTPFLKHVKVHAEVLRHLKSKKIIVFKFKRRKRYKKKLGHRSQLTELLIKKIVEEES